ncbi:MAG: hypothetical protein ACYTEK_04770 [Planctomycetota bacterium]
MMREYLSIKRETSLAETVLGPDGIRGLAISLSVGVFAGWLAASWRLHLGLPGHKAIAWMTPVITARLLGRCRIGTTAGAFTAALISLSLGGNLAGGLLGLPFVGAAGMLVDACVLRLEKRRASTLTTIIVIAFSAMLANLICCAKRLLVPMGIASHEIFGSASILLRPVFYGLFGFLAGLIAAAGAHLIQRRQKPSQQN